MYPRRRRLPRLGRGRRDPRGPAHHGHPDPGSPSSAARRSTPARCSSPRTQTPSAPPARRPRRSSARPRPSWQTSRPAGGGERPRCRAGPGPRGEERTPAGRHESPSHRAARPGGSLDEPASRPGPLEPGAGRGPASLRRGPPPQSPDLGGPGTGDPRPSAQRPRWPAPPSPPPSGSSSSARPPPPPRAGWSTRTYRMGEMVPSGAAVLSLLPDGALRVRFFVPEPKLASVPVGAPVRVTCDGCPRPLDAQVSYVSPSPEFTPPVIYSRRRPRAARVPGRGAAPAPPGLHPGSRSTCRCAR